MSFLRRRYSRRNLRPGGKPVTKAAPSQTALPSAPGPHTQLAKSLRSQPSHPWKPTQTWGPCRPSGAGVAAGTRELPRSLGLLLCPPPPSTLESMLSNPTCWQNSADSQAGFTLRVVDSLCTPSSWQFRGGPRKPPGTGRCAHTGHGVPHVG